MPDSTDEAEARPRSRAVYAAIRSEDIRAAIALGPAALAVYMALRAEMGGLDEWWIPGGLAGLGELAGYSRTSARRAVDALVEAGLVVVVRRTDDGGRDRPAAYRLPDRPMREDEQVVHPRTTGGPPTDHRGATRGPPVVHPWPSGGPPTDPPVVHPRTTLRVGGGSEEKIRNEDPPQPPASGGSTTEIQSQDEPMPRTPPRPPTDRTPTGIAGDVDALLAAAGAGRRRLPPSTEPAATKEPTPPPRQEAPDADGTPDVPDGTRKIPHPVRPDATPLGLTRAEWTAAAEQLRASAHTHRVGVILASHLDGWPCPEDAAELRAYAAEVASSDWRRVEAAMKAGPPVAGSPAWLDTPDEAARAALAAAAREGLPMIAEDKNRQRARDARAWAAIVEAAPILARVAGRRSP